MKSVFVRQSLTKFVLLMVLLISGCSFDSPNDSVVVTVKPVNPTPANNSTNQGMSLQLSWESVNALKYDVYLDTQNPPLTKIASDLTSKSYSVTYLGSNTRYYWKVVAKNDAGATESDVWSFTTGTSINPDQSGDFLILKNISTEKPCYVNMIYQVVGYDGVGIGGLTKDDFELLEDGAAVSTSESDVIINQKADVFDTLKVVVMLDNSTSLTANIEQIRGAASNLVYNLVNSTVNGTKLNVMVSVYTFSETVTKLCDFISNKDRLYGVVWDNYALGKASTNLYGAVITGASKWTDVMTTDKIRQGIMILFTDGSDTQGSRTYADALLAVNNKKVFTVGLGNDIDPNVLERLGTSGYFQITDINELSSKFQTVQQEIIDYISSIYVLKYKSPKRGNFEHMLKLKIKNNQNTGSGSFIEGYYNSYGFYSN